MDDITITAEQREKLQKMGEEERKEKGKKRKEGKEGKEGRAKKRVKREGENWVTTPEEMQLWEYPELCLPLSMCPSPLSRLPTQTLKLSVEETLKYGGFNGIDGTGSGLRSGDVPPWPNHFVAHGKHAPFPYPLSLPPSSLPSLPLSPFSPSPFVSLSLSPSLSPPLSPFPSPLSPPLSFQRLTFSGTSTDPRGWETTRHVEEGDPVLLRTWKRVKDDNGRRIVKGSGGKSQSLLTAQGSTHVFASPLLSMASIHAFFKHIKPTLTTTEASKEFTTYVLIFPYGDR